MTVLWDLSHSLRVIAEMKSHLAAIEPGIASSQLFWSCSPKKRFWRQVSRVRHLICYFPGAVSVIRRGDHLFGQIGTPTDKFQQQIQLRVTEREWQFGYAQFAETNLQDDEQAIFRGNRSTLTFKQWLEAEAVRVAFPVKSGLIENFTLSREMVIKRTANTLDASHSSGVADHSNANDKAIREILKYRLGDLPLVYVLLLKYAQDILTHLPSLLGMTAVPDMPTLDGDAG